MENEQIYEILLQTQCEAYQDMLGLLERIERLDEALAAVSSQNRPDIRKISTITSQKEHLIQRLDILSLHATQAYQELEGMSELWQEISTHPLYLRMDQLKLAAYQRITAVIKKEDLQNSDIIKHLEDYKEALTLDIKIKDIPLSKRQIFVFIPNRRKP